LTQWERGVGHVQAIGAAVELVRDACSVEGMTLSGGADVDCYGVVTTGAGQDASSTQDGLQGEVLDGLVLVENLATRENWRDWQGGWLSEWQAEASTAAQSWHLCDASAKLVCPSYVSCTFAAERRKESPARLETLLALIEQWMFRFV
jgi:hypothetical protein